MSEPFDQTIVGKVVEATHVGGGPPAEMRIWFTDGTALHMEATVGGGMTVRGLTQTAQEGLKETAADARERLMATLRRM